jgi:hypothetical protein
MNEGSGSDFIFDYVHAMCIIMKCGNLCYHADTLNRNVLWVGMTVHVDKEAHIMESISLASHGHLQQRREQ